MQAITTKMADLKEEILPKIDQNFIELKLDQIKKEVFEVIKIEIKKPEELESTLSLPDEHVNNFQKHISLWECKK